MNSCVPPPASPLFTRTILKSAIGDPQSKVGPGEMAPLLSPSPHPMGRGTKGEVVPLPPFPFSPLLLFICFVSFACFVVPTPAAVFITNSIITETNFAYDGQDIVVSGATLTVDGRHSSPSS
jgi:hypothetical protein